MKKTLTAITAGLIIAAGATSGTAQATGTAVDCTDPDTGTWSIFNERDGRSLTFTTDQGHAGEVGPLETVTVQYFGTSLTVFSILDNGVERTNTGRGDCFPEETSSTTTDAPPTSTETTVPEDTTTTVPPSTQPPATTTTNPPTSDTTEPPTTVDPRFAVFGNRECLTEDGWFVDWVVQSVVSPTGATFTVVSPEEFRPAGDNWTSRVLYGPETTGATIVVAGEWSDGTTAQVVASVDRPETCTTITTPPDTTVPPATVPPPPSQPTTPTNPPPVTLPETGGTIDTTGTLGLILVGLGSLVTGAVALSRRRTL